MGLDGRRYGCRQHTEREEISGGWLHDSSRYIKT
jgi:hypothetical protein